MSPAETAWEGTARQRDAARGHGRWLWLLLALFLARVVAEPIQSRFALPVLPPAEAWASGALPYPLLLGSQVLILVAAGWTAWRFSTGRVVARARLGRWLIILGAVYFLAMLARLTLGLTLYAGHPWLDKPVPAFFHLVLAAFLLVAGHYHRRFGTELH